MVDEVVTEYLSTEDSIPAVGQGALAIECREDDAELIAELKKLSDEDTWVTIHAERAFLAAMDGGCQVPIAGYATINGGGNHIDWFSSCSRCICCIQRSSELVKIRKHLGKK